MKGVSSGAAESSIHREPHGWRLRHGFAGQRPAVDHVAALSDPRQHAKVLYPLPEILLLVLAATIAGADDFVETTLWGTAHLAFLRRFYRYESGIPSHDTLCDVFAALDPELLKSLLSGLDQWLARRRPGDQSRLTERFHGAAYRGWRPRVRGWLRSVASAPHRCRA